LPDRITLQGPYDRDEFHEIDTALTALIVGHERLFAELFG
jgi:hypothetical protein